MLQEAEPEVAVSEVVEWVVAAVVGGWPGGAAQGAAGMVAEETGVEQMVARKAAAVA